METVSKSNTITCAICGKWEGQIIIRHLKEAHPKVSAATYMAKYNAPLATAAAWSRHLASAATVEERPTESCVVHEIFGLSPENDPEKNIARRFVNRSVERFAVPHPLTPPADPDYVFPEEPLKRLLLGLSLQARNRVWLHGYSGTGKTQLVLQTANRLGYGVLRVSGDLAISRRQLIGDWTVRDGATVFVHGVVPRAMREGHILLLDEVDHLAPAVLAILRPVLEDPSTLTILENGSEVIQAHPAFRVVATANTSGAGDDSGLYSTSRGLSLADRQRFSIWAKVEFMPADQEADMLRKKFPKLTEIELSRFQQVVETVRTRFTSGQYEESFSPRELLNWVEKYLATGDALLSASMCFLDRYASNATRIGVAEVIASAFNIATK